MLLRDIIFIILLHGSSAYNILSILPLKARSHTIFASALLEALAQKGHNVTVFTSFPERKNLPNLYEIDIGYCFPPVQILNDIEKAVNMTIYEFVHVIPIAFVAKPEHVKTCEPLQKLFHSTQHFDVTITQPYGSDVFAAFSYKLNTPLINVFSMRPLPHLAERMASITNPSIVPTTFLGTLNLNSFFNRVRNMYHYSMLMWHLNTLRQDDEVISDLFGPGIPSLADITKNTSLIFTNTHFSFTQSAIPLSPAIIDVGGIHIKNASKLPEHIEKFMNESKHGVVYFSMGSLIKSTTFPDEKRNAFLYAFSEIPQRVLWKWDDNTLSGVSDNIMISKWMPQRDILAHPNMKLFISHGGLQSISEAVYEGVPVLGIPIFADQRNNIDSLEINEVGELLQYHDISKDVVLDKMQRLINEPRYMENMKRISRRYKDRPLSPAETAVYWTEYVIRHRGAHFLRPASLNMPWYQYLLIDVITFVLFTFVIILLVGYFTSRVILLCIRQSLFRSSYFKSSAKVKPH